MIDLKTLLAVVLLYLSSNCGAAATPDPAGTWHGDVDSPRGPLTLVVRIERDDAGMLTGTLESVDQAPGQEIPIGKVTHEAGLLSLTLRAIGARYEAEWDPEARHWSGEWTQGAAMPLTLRPGLPPSLPVIEGLDGDWHGVITRNGVDLRLILHVRTDERGTHVTLDSPDMAAQGIPVAAVSREGDMLRFTVPAVGVRYEGRIGGDGSTLSGPWRFPGRPETTVTFERRAGNAEARAPARPQTPEPPFDYRVEEVTFNNPAADGVRLAGTLTLPPGQGPFPAAVLISGSGPQDRDETLLGHKPFAVLADHLTRQGIVVLRYDDRGFGESTGDFSSATSADFATDAVAAVGYLAGRAAIDADAIGLVGHSEGGMIAPIAASNSEEIDYLVLLAAPGTGTRDLALSQRRLMGTLQGMSEAELDRSEPIVEAIFDALAEAENGEQAEAAVRAVLSPEALAVLGVPESRREVIAQANARDWIRFFIRHDPKAALRKVRVPVLAINGDLDRQVPADANLAAIEAALANNPDVTTRKLEGLNHLFQSARTGAIGEYRDIEETFAPEALDLVGDWITSRFVKR